MQTISPGVSLPAPQSEPQQGADPQGKRKGKKRPSRPKKKDVQQPWPSVLMIQPPEKMTARLEGPPVPLEIPHVNTPGMPDSPSK